MAFLFRVPLAWKNLTDNWRRLTAAVCGIGFAVVLMFMETGFENALFDSTVEIFHNLDADFVLASKAQYALLSGETFDLQRIYQARACEGVEAACPVYVELYRAVLSPPRRSGNPIRVLAYHPEDQVFLQERIRAAAGHLQQPNTALFDVKSKAKHEIPRRADELANLSGAELAGKSIRLVGVFELGTDFINDGSLIMSAKNFAKYCPFFAGGDDPLSQVTLGIVRTAPDVDLQQAKSRLDARLPADVAVYTKQEFIDHELSFWEKSTPIGFIFSLGVTIGFVVGVIICYQILHSDVTDHLQEFATLKAMGYRTRYFATFILCESLYLSVLSFIPGLAVSLALYHGLAEYTGLLMILNLPRAAFVFVLTTAMCCVSGALAMRKVLSADPADLF